MNKPTYVQDYQAIVNVLNKYNDGLQASRQQHHETGLQRTGNNVQR